MTVESVSSELLADLAVVGAFSLESMKQQKAMQHDHVEAAIQRIGHSEFGIERGLPCLRHDGAVKRICYGLVPAIASEQAAEMLVQAQASVDERYRMYEDFAARDGSRFLPHWEDATP